MKLIKNKITKIKCGVTGHNFEKFATFHKANKIIYLCNCGKKKEVKQ